MSRIITAAASPSDCCCLLLHHCSTNLCFSESLICSPLTAHLRLTLRHITPLLPGSDIGMGADRTQSMEPNFSEAHSAHLARLLSPLWQFFFSFFQCSTFSSFSLVSFRDPSCHIKGHVQTPVAGQLYVFPCRALGPMQTSIPGHFTPGTNLNCSENAGRI